MTDFLVRRIARQPRRLPTRLALGLGLAALAVAIRLALAPLIGLGAPFTAYVLAVLVAAVFGGVASAVACMLLLAAAGLAMLTPAIAAVGPKVLRRTVLSVAFFLASSGFVIWVTTLLRAALAREVAMGEAERLLKMELHHRVKNTLAVVQALADQTFRSARDTDAARRDFAERLVALAQAHDVLVDAGWGEVTLEALAVRALAPFRPAEAGRLVVEGPEVRIPPEPAVALALCLHELATNAAKHGALGPAGGVRLSWRVEADGERSRLHVDWREHGGPVPAPGGHAGFGARLLQRALAAQPNAEAALALPPEGAHWTAAFDL